MNEVQLFVAIAEIAGVFVGFGALISVTRRGENEPLGQIRAVVTIGLIVMVAAMIPVALSAYGLAGRALWVTASVAFLALDWFVIVVSLRVPLTRGVIDRYARTHPLAAISFWALEMPVQIPLLLVILGIFSRQEAAFYTTALAFNLFEAALMLAQFVYSRQPRD